MHKLITIFLILFVPLSVFSQDEYVKLKDAKTQKPTYIFNKKIIGNEFLIRSLGTSEKQAKEKVNELSVLKIKGNRKDNDYYNLTDYGLRTSIFGLKRNS